MHDNIGFGIYLYLFRRHSPGELSLITCVYKQGGLLYSAGPHGKVARAILGEMKLNGAGGWKADNTEIPAVGEACIAI